jgi:glycerol-3-phosphate dehydrogenase
MKRFNMPLLYDRFKNLKKEYDLIIVGGGIYGATLLWEATLRGLSSILIEKGDFCSGTSANSLKIIHGGLRYLQAFDIKRMRESANELNILLKIAPHLIQPLPFVIPTYRQLNTSKLAMRLAFKSYHLVNISKVNGFKDLTPSSKILSKNEFGALIPAISLHDETGGALWHDALNYNSERLALEFILSALDHGADAFNYLELQDLILGKSQVTGIQVYDKLSKQPLEIFGKFVVNATGPWINKVIQKITPDRSKNNFKFVKAINLIIRRSFSKVAFGLKDFDSPVDDYSQSNRFLFFVPWRGATMIGTWYFTHSSSADEVSLNESEYLKCIGQIQRLLPDAEIREDEVSYVHSGLIPIEPNNGNKKFELRSSYSLIDHNRHGGPEGLISVLGVKYTTARNIAAKTVELISRKLSRELRSLAKGNQPLSGGDIKPLEEFILEKRLNDHYNLPAKTVRHLARNFGAKYDAVEKLINGNGELGNLIPGSEETIKAELLYCLKNELVSHLSDLLLRRTDVGSLQKPGDETISFCADYMAMQMGWSESQKQNEISSLLAHYDRFPINSV